MINKICMICFGNCTKNHDIKHIEKMNTAEKIHIKPKMLEFINLLQPFSAFSIFLNACGLGLWKRIVLCSWFYKIALSAYSRDYLSKVDLEVLNKPGVKGFFCKSIGISHTRLSFLSSLNVLTRQN